MQEQHKELVYIPAERASKRIGVTTQTLRGWAAAGKIGVVVTPGGRFRYAVDAFLAKQALETERVQAELAKKKATRDAARRQRIDRKRQQEAARCRRPRTLHVLVGPLMGRQRQAYVFIWKSGAP
jgi:hypothetical protein